MTQQEIESLLDAFFELSSADFLDQVLSTLSPDSRQTLKQILSPRESASSTKIPTGKPVSLAKLEEQWATLWGAWAAVVEEAAQEDGEYMEQEAHWEPPYFDNTAFVDDLEKVAEKMLPLLETAFENEFTPDTDFAEAMQEAYEDISSAMSEGMELQEGLSLKKHLTRCLLTWRWLWTASEKEDAFGFAQDLRAWEKEYPHFFRVVIRPGELKHLDDASRQTYVKQYAPTDLLERVMVYWNAQLQYWVPDPKMASKSDYTSHAQWMAALKEVAPGVYATLLEKWRVEHKNRRNLWQAMSHMGLGSAIGNGKRPDKK